MFCFTSWLQGYTTTAEHVWQWEHEATSHCAQSQSKERCMLALSSPSPYISAQNSMEWYHPQFKIPLSNSLNLDKSTNSHVQWLVSCQADNMIHHICLTNSHHTFKLSTFLWPLYCLYGKKNCFAQGAALPV